MTKRGYKIKGWLYAVCAAVSVVMLATGIFAEPIVYMQIALFPVMAWMNFKQANDRD